MEWSVEDDIAVIHLTTFSAQAADGIEVDQVTLDSTTRQLVGNLLPPEGDFLAIIIDALGGNDQITGTDRDGDAVARPVSWRYEDGPPPQIFMAAEPAGRPALTPQPLATAFGVVKRARFC